MATDRTPNPDADFYAYSVIQRSDVGLASVGSALAEYELNNITSFCQGVWLIKTEFGWKCSMERNIRRNILQLCREFCHRNKRRSLRHAGYDQTPGFLLGGNYYVVKTEPALPPPTPTPTPSSQPSICFLSEKNLLLFVSSALAVILITILAVAVLRLREKQP